MASVQNGSKTRMKVKFLIHCLIIMLVLSISTAWIWKLNSTLSRNSFLAISGTQENYSWAIAKFSIKVFEFNSLIEKQLRTSGIPIKDIEYKLDLIFSRLKVISDKSESTRFLYAEKDYIPTITFLDKMLNLIDEEMKKKEPNYEYIISILEQMKPKTNLLNNIADHAEVTQRTVALTDFLERRTQLRVLFFFAYSLIIILCFISFYYVKSLTKALSSEKNAFNSKNAFLGKLGHELRTSLQSVIGSIDVLSNSTDEKINKAIINRLEQTAFQIESQMRDLAEFAKVDNGIIEINKTVFNIGHLVRMIVNECSLMLSNKNIEIISNNIQDVYIESDSNRVSQVIENILTNAIKYTEKGVVSIDVHLDRKQNLVITVTDTGYGIPKDKIKNIFKPFIRIENEKSKTPGFGMGLAIVDGVVRAMKGYINVNSKLGEGTTFTIVIPVKLSDEVKFIRRVESHTAHMIKQDLKILIVDDNESSCSTIASMLKISGYESEQTTKPERALQKLMRKSFDLVLCDLQMPLITGDILLHEIRTHDGPNKNTPFIFISAYEFSSNEYNTPLLTKPVRIDDIVHQINATLPNK